MVWEGHLVEDKGNRSSALHQLRIVVGWRVAFVRCRHGVGPRLRTMGKKSISAHCHLWDIYLLEQNVRLRA